ncbi:MAG: outer membrane lipoprotein carrier protein LolA [Lysobacterales bacterium]|nr:MAG: outer membrane lipoprotein carrier protein LolA [Xanthomonadales bacterium]
MFLKPAQLAALAVVSWLGTGAMAHALELSEVLERTRVSPPGRVAFRETRYNPLLEEPMEFTGYLEYPRAGQLRKVVESPFQESMLVDGDTIELVRAGRTQRVSLRNRKSILRMLQSIESLLAGNISVLEETFEHELSGTEDKWRLRLTPTAKSLAKQLDQLTVCGGLGTIDKIRFDMQNGEWQHLEIIHTASEP